MYGKLPSAGPTQRVKEGAEELGIKVTEMVKS